MYQVMLVFQSEELLEDVRNLTVWGEKSEFAVVKAVRSGEEAYREMRKRTYDLVLLEPALSGMEAQQLLRRAKYERLCDNVAFCGVTPDFSMARQGILLGAFDYLVKPFDVNQFYAMFTRIKNKVSTSGAYEVFYVDELLLFFENRDDGIVSYVDELFDKLYRTQEGGRVADRIAGQICRSVADAVFAGNDWLDLYLSQEKFCEDRADGEKDTDVCRRYYRDKIVELYREYAALFPNIHNEKIREVILYILYNPESDLKQKTIADNLYLNSSYLSTVFSAHTDLRFVDYLTTVKMKRAGWLLRETGGRIAEIAERLGYRDTGYFSRLFKKQFGITPTEYRIPDNYIFHI